MIDLANAVVYDIECLPNVFTLCAESLHRDDNFVWEVSEFRDDRRSLFAWFEHLRTNQIPMIGFNNMTYDYVMIHDFFQQGHNWNNQILYELSQSLIKQPVEQFKRQIWESDRFTPQIDLFRIHHFNNKAKSTSLKALQVNMRSRFVVEGALPWDRPASEEDIQRVLIPYNRHDVSETKKFAHFSRKALDFRISLQSQVQGDVLNFDDTKLGAKIMEQRLGDELCYYRDGNNKRQKRQTPRDTIRLADIIFPYISFNDPEFARVLEWMRAQTLTKADMEDKDSRIQTKGVFKGVSARVGGIDFQFGTGGIHASVPSQRFVATDEWLIRDIDVAALYPNIGIKNRLAPAHLGGAFVKEYARLPEDRKRYQETHGKKSVEANSMKLASNGTYGNTNSPHSIFYDPQYTMTITINGQLMLCMLAEWLCRVPTLQLIQANTDGITYRVHRDHEPQAAAWCRQWEAHTLLTLEDVSYRRMWIRDVGSYIAEAMDGSLKLKGAYWHPDPERYADSISETQPPSWHKDLSNVVSIRAANAQMIHGIPLETFIRTHTDRFDFMCRAKVDRQSQLFIGTQEVQRVTRYYVARDGAPMRKVSPPPEGCVIGEYKRAPKIDDLTFRRVMSEIAPGTWDERIHTKNKSRYELRETQFEAGWLVRDCNDAANFSFTNIAYEYYEQEARKLIIQ